MPHIAIFTAGCHKHSHCFILWLYLRHSVTIRLELYLRRDVTLAIAYNISLKCNEKYEHDREWLNSSSEKIFVRVLNKAKDARVNDSDEDLKRVDKALVFKGWFGASSARSLYIHQKSPDQSFFIKFWLWRLFKITYFSSAFFSNFQFFNNLSSFWIMRIKNALFQIDV